jgi:hypothetical protein
VANLWLKSRALRREIYETGIWVDAANGSYADIIREGRRFRFSHEAITRDKFGTGTVWLVFEDAGADGPIGTLRGPG